MLASPIADNKTEYSGLESEIPAALARTVGGLKNIKILSSSENADFIIAPKVNSLTRGRGLGSLQGTSSTQEQGGLAVGAITARQYKVSAKVALDFYERQNSVLKKIWTRSFSASSTYDSSLRLIPAAGASSASIINASRESVALQSLAESIAKQFKDQVFQGF